MSRDQPRRYLVAYDIPLDSRRTALAKKLESYGDRVQYSVFVVDARPAKMLRLRRELTELAVTAEDSILICDLGLLGAVDDDRYGYIGRQRPLTPSAVISI